VVLAGALVALRKKGLIAQSNITEQERRRHLRSVEVRLTGMQDINSSANYYYVIIAIVVRKYQLNYMSLEYLLRDVCQQVDCFGLCM